MPPKKAAKPAAEESAKPSAPAEFEPSDFAVGPDDPSYQRPAFGSEKDLKVLEEGPEARRDAVLADIKKMHGG